MARTDLDFNTYKKRLLEEREKALGDISEADDELDMGQVPESLELTTYDDHQADIATDLVMREQQVVLVDNIRHVVDQIDHALAKIDDGTYGLCDFCLKEIPVERLDFEPYATVCIEDLERIEGTATDRVRNESEDRD